MPEHGFSLASNIPAVTPTVALFQAKDLGKAQSLYRLVTTLKIVLPILALLLLAAGVWAARGRRRTLVRAALGVAASMLILGIGLQIARGIYLNSVPSSTLPSDAAAAAFDALVHFLENGLRVVLLVGLIVAIAAYFTGPSRTAVQTRSALKSGADWVPGLRRAQGHIRRPGRAVDVPAPHGPPDRGGGPRRPHIRLLERAYRASGHRDRRRAAHPPRPDRADRRQAAGRTAEGWSGGALTPSRHDAEADA